jgi:hypothetical protein
MDTIPTEHFGPRRPTKKPPLLQTAASLLLAPQDQFPDDEGNDVVPAYCRFIDLQRAQICSSWAQLKRLIEEQGFPPGILASPNVRIFAVAEVRRWLAGRPVADSNKEVNA